MKIHSICSQHFSKTAIVLLLSCLFGLTSSGQRTPLTKSPYGPGSTEEKIQYLDTSGSTHYQTIVRDGNGTARELRDSVTYTESDGMGGTDTYTFESFTKYDCNGNPIYDRFTLTKNGQEVKYEDNVYDPSKGIRHRVSGYKSKTDILGELKKQKWDPATKRWVPIASLPVTNENYASIEPPENACPPDGSCAYSQFDVFVGYSHARAEGGAKGLGFPLGVNVAATYNLSSRFGLVLDGSLHFRKDGDQKWDRQYILGGAEYLCYDCNCDCDEDDSHTGPKLSAHLLVGYAKDGFKVMNFKNSESGFAAAIGGGIESKLNGNSQIKLRIDAIPIFFKNNTTIDYRASLGIDINFGKKAYKKTLSVL